MRELLALPMLVMPLCFGQDARVEFEGRYWAPASSPQVKIEAPFAVDFGRDLGTGNPQVPDLRFTFRPGNSRLQFGYSRFDFTGDQAVSRTVEFNGRVYTFGTRIVTSAQINDIKVGWSYALVRVADGRIKIGPLVEGHAVWWDASLAAPALGVTASDKRTIGFPTVGVAAEFTPHPRFAVLAEAAGMTAGDYGRFYNAEAGVRFSPVRHLNAVAGYRIYDLYPRFDPDYARLRLRGPFVGVAAGF